MAELLVKAVDATHPDPAKDARGCYKRGDVVCVRDNGHPWGGRELKAPAAGGKFVILKVTDVTAQQVATWVRHNWSCEVEGPDVAGGKRRRVRIDVDLVPTTVRQTLSQTGQYSTTWVQIRQYLHNKATDATAANSPIG